MTFSVGQLWNTTGLELFHEGKPLGATIGRIVDWNLTSWFTPTGGCPGINDIQGHVDVACEGWVYSIGLDEFLVHCTPLEDN